MSTDLSITKTDGTASVVPGSVDTYTVVVTNNGPDAVIGAGVSDLFPSAITAASWTAVASAGSNVAQPGGTGNIATTVDLLPGGAATFTAVAQISLSATATISNTATVTAPAGVTDTNPANNAATDTDIVTPLVADLAVTKTDGTASVVPGSVDTYTVVVTNNGPDAVIGAGVSDLFPSAITAASWTAVASAGSSVAQPGGTGNIATTVDLLPGGAATFTALAQISPSATGTISNTATVTAPAGVTDTNTANNAATDTDTISTADLSLSKSVSDATPNVGDQTTFTVTLSDLGPDAATGVRVTDLLPAGLTFVSANASQGSYNPGSGAWTVGTVSPGVPQTLSITATVFSPAAQTNTGIISHADQFDPNTANNSASATETPQQADLSLSKSESDATPNVGDQTTFTVTLSDLGPDAATGVQVTDLLPAGLTFVSANPSQGSYDNLSGAWTVGTVSPGVPQTLSVTATVVSLAAQTNTATISDADQFDPNTANNSASATETPPADLSLSKSVSDATPNVGDQTTFTITLTDQGPNAATGVQVTDLLPAGLTFVSANASQGSYNPGSGAWTVGTVSPGVPQTLSITATVFSPAAQTNTGIISHADQFDPNTANNSASATETPQQADLSLSKSVSDATPNVGDQTTFTVTLSDLGPDAATGVQVTDLLPAGLTFVSANPSQGSYDNLSGAWTVGTVSPGVPQTLSIRATVVSPAAQTNTATISDADQFDPNTANNSASATETPQQADFLVATDSGPQTLSGLGGDDTLLALGSGAYVLDGGTGNDLLNASGSGSETLTGGLGNDTLATFGSGNYALDGGDGNDSLQANGSGAETLTGGNGNDTLQELAGAGQHSLDGGNGDDVLNYRGSGTNNDTLTGGAGNDTLASFGAGTVAMDGGDGNDSLQANGSGAETLTGGNGSDTVQELASAGQHSLDGGNGDDNLNYSGSGTNNDTLTGGAGNDTLASFGASTTAIVAMDGGDGNDSLQANGAGAETLTGGNGNDTVHELASAGQHSLDGGNGDDVLNYSGSGTNHDTMTGGIGNDLMVSWGSGTVAMDGGEGNDTLQANGPATGADTLSGGNGDDVVNDLATSGSHSLDGGAGNDSLNYSGTSLDTLSGGDGNDTIGLYGSGTGNTVNGGNGDDRTFFGLAAGQNDTIDGGAGTDTVVFLSRSTTNIVSEQTNGSGVTTIIFDAGGGGQTVFVQNVEFLRFTTDNSSQGPNPPTPFPTI